MIFSIELASRTNRVEFLLAEQQGNFFEDGTFLKSWGMFFTFMSSFKWSQTACVLLTFKSDCFWLFCGKTD